jgi:hypothetical protein
MKFHRAAFWGFFLCLVALGASARQDYPAKIPNGEAFNPAGATQSGCQICHVTIEGGGQKTPFGDDVLDNKNGIGATATIAWRVLALLDSDGDGLTNGEELGDPCALWFPGETPTRSDNLSNPGLFEDTAAGLGEVTCPDAGPAPEDAGGVDSGKKSSSDAGGDLPPPGGCPCTGEGGSADLSLAAAPLVLWRTRRRWRSSLPGR